MDVHSADPPERQVPLIAESNHVRQGATVPRSLAFRARLLLIGFPWIAAVLIRGSTLELGFGDSGQYRAMAEHPGIFTVAPFGYRILVPDLAALIAKLTPLDIDSAFFALSLLCFVSINLTLGFWFLIRFRLRWPTCLLLMGLYSFSYAGAYNLHNYVHVGLPEHLMILAGFIAIYEERFAWLLAVILAGSFVKETTLLLIPLYVLYARRSGTRAASIARRFSVLALTFLAVFCLLRSGIPFVNHPGFTGYTRLYAWVDLRRIHEYYGGYHGAVKQTLAAFPVLWPLAAIGYQVSDTRVRSMAFFIPLTLVQILLATDVTRMASLAFPAILLMVAGAFRMMSGREACVATALSVLVFYLYDLRHRMATFAVLAACYGLLLTWYLARRWAWRIRETRF